MTCILAGPRDAIALGMIAVQLRHGVWAPRTRDEQPLAISAFVHALRAYKSGNLDFDDLSSEVDRQLAVERASSVALLAILKAQQAAQPLPDDTHDALSKRITEWPEDPTIVTGMGRRQCVERTVGGG